ncbi:TPA: hypothetical protein DCL30_02615 [Candidatus Peribacteria bacterium]|nr:hypothetical protein [Candidatus Peribacteria bacterium]HAS34000.1 hypothetical protein [Candidatus Peribacteria bacterium]
MYRRGVAKEAKICYTNVMLHVEIEIQNGKGILLTIGSVIVAILVVQTFMGERATAAVGGVDESTVHVVQDAEDQIHRLRIEQAVLDRREEIVRSQLRALAQEREERAGQWSEEDEQQSEQARMMLVELLQDRARAEQMLRESLRQLWDAEGRALTTVSAPRAKLGELVWPVNPSQGISAVFLDEAYEKTFGIPHKGIDIPVMQGSLVRAAADGVVEKVTDNGLGFNSIIIRHEGGATLYGHVNQFLVKEGQTVHRGSPIARSGGRPGTPGAGAISTGPHLHFEVIADGVRVDPLTLLPRDVLTLGAAKP